MPSTPMLASTVVFLPRSRGVEQAGPLSSLGPSVKRVKRDVGSQSPPRRGAAWGRFLGRPSPSRRPSAILRPVPPPPRAPFFRPKPSRFRSRPTVETLRILPVACSKKPRLCKTVAAGGVCTSSSSSFSMVGSVLGGLPPPFLGSQGTRTPLGDLHVALDRGEAHTEQASSAGFGDAFLERFYDPPRA